MTRPAPDEALHQYEAVRREALATAPGPRGHGLALLVTRGMAAWLTALAALGPRRGLPAIASAPRETPGTMLPTVRTELTTVLAGMVLACATLTEEGSR
ncbi:MAG: hypothetical protein ACREMR_08300 [Gemmatimonadales bacterium]